MRRFPQGALVLAALLPACRSPTQISVDVVTDVPCGQVTITSFTSGELGAIESLPPAAESTACTGNHLGTMVLVPSSAGDGANVAFKIVTALDGESASACSGTAAAGNPKCIVERRALNYIPNDPLEVIVDMSAACEGKICDAQSTCVNGACVNAVIPDPSSCEGAGCGDTVLVPLPDAGGVDATLDASSDAPTDASSDAPIDAPIDANDSGAATPDSGADAGVDSGSIATSCTPGAQKCASASSVETCGMSGTWGPPWPCATNLCAGGACASFTAGTSSPSCAGGGPGLSNCGDGGDSCCASLEVPGGTYDRTYNGATGGPDPATVSGFRLDKYLVTVGRYRRFVNAWDGGAGFEPDAGSGKHAHLNGGQGLVAVGEDAGLAYEPGWLATDDVNVSPPSHLACQPPFDTWTDAGASQENLPINCVVWAEAYAFCIWDGGFLPSEAEWAFAAAGGSQQLVYPWGSTDPGAANLYAIYGSDNASCYYPGPGLPACTGVSNFAPVGSAPMGAGVWGQLDMGGEVFEWALDWYWFFADPCVDCVFMNPNVNDYRSVRGGAFNVSGNYLSGAQRYWGTPVIAGDATGFRCARSP
jgi:formylglycine-generating enzyme required for sulfatase activity